MLADSTIRNRVIALAETIDSAPIESDISAVLQRAGRHRKRQIATGVAVGVAALAMALTLWGDAPFIQDARPLPPVRDNRTQEERKDTNRSIEERRRQSDAAVLTVENLDSEQPEGPSGSGHVSAAPDRPTSAEAVAARQAERTFDRPQALRQSHQYQYQYEMRPISTQYPIDGRAGCEPLVGDCHTIHVNPEDEFARVNVDDASSRFVPVQVVQWTQSGHPISRFTFCGGLSPMIQIRPFVDTIEVSIKRNGCSGHDMTPTRGTIHATFYARTL